MGRGGQALTRQAQRTVHPAKVTIELGTLRACRIRQLSMGLMARLGAGRDNKGKASAPLPPQTCAGCSSGPAWWSSW